MALDVMSLLKTTRQEKKGDVEQLAAQLHAGDDIQPQTILATLAGCGATDEDLQNELVRLERVEQLRADITAAGPATKQLAKLTAEGGKLRTKADEALAAVRAWEAKHDEKLTDLRLVVSRAERYRDEVLLARNLSNSQGKRLEAAQAAIEQASQRLTDLREQLRRSQVNLREAQRLLEDFEGDSKQLRVKQIDAETRKQRQSLEATVKRQTERVGTLTADLTRAETALEKAQREADDLRETIRREVLG